MAAFFKTTQIKYVCNNLVYSLLGQLKQSKKRGKGNQSVRGTLYYSKSSATYLLNLTTTLLYLRQCSVKAVSSCTLTKGQGKDNK